MSNKPFRRLFFLVLMFTLTRILLFLSWLHPAARFVSNDISYYGFYLVQWNQGNTAVMGEYPVLAVWILNLLYSLGGGWQTWLPVFASAMILLDAAIALVFVRRSFKAALFWTLFTAANGSIAWFRFDLIPAALVALAAYFLITHPRFAGTLLAFGAAVKLWPALLISVMLSPNPTKKTTRQRLLGFVTTGIVLASVSVFAVGFVRNLSPLSFQSHRGLHVESVPATALMMWRTYTDLGHYELRISQYNALEIFGPGVSFLLSLSTILLALSVATAIGLGIVLYRRQASYHSMLLATTAVCLCLIVANKTLSPQYILWLGGPVAALLSKPAPSRLRPHLQILALSFLLVGALTQLEYPWLALEIIAIPHGSPLPTAILVLRNALLIALTGYVIWLTLLSTSHECRQPAMLNHADVAVCR